MMESAFGKIIDRAEHFGKTPKPDQNLAWEQNRSVGSYRKSPKGKFFSQKEMTELRRCANRNNARWVDSCAFYIDGSRTRAN